MKTIQMTLDEDLVQKVDEVVRVMQTTRSEFTRAVSVSRSNNLRRDSLRRSTGEDTSAAPSRRVNSACGIRAGLGG